MTRWIVWALVLGAAASAAVAEQTVQAVKYVQYKNAEFKFAAEVPEHWVAEGKSSPTSTVVVFSGPKGTDEYLTTVNFQIVQRKPQGEDGIDVRARDIQRQWGTAAKYQLISQEKAQLAGIPSVRMIAQYEGPGSTAMYKHEQYVCEKGQNFYLVSYSGPVELYAKHYATLERVIKTFQFLS